MENYYLKKGEGKKMTEQIKTKKKVNHLVFWPPFIILLAAVIVSLVNEEAFAAAMYGAYGWITSWFGWGYLLFGFIAVVLLLVALVSPWRKIKFGGKDAVPNYSRWKYFNMVLCSSVAIGIVFWGVAEPITHLALPARGIEPFSPEAVLWATSHNFAHWGLTVYAIYIIAAIPIGLAVYNYNQKISIATGMYFCLGEKSYGKPGKIVDGLCIFGLVGTMAASMGAGIMQLTSGVSYISGLVPTTLVWLIVAIIIMVTYSTSSIIGIDKGMNFLSSQNVRLYALVIIFIFIVGPTQYILSLFLESTGEYISEFVSIHTWLGADSGEDWTRWWTIFYFAAWVAYGPVAGVFLTRISYGRTIKEFVLICLLAPTLFAMIWFSVFGGTAIDFQLSGQFDIAGAITENGQESAVFAFFEQLPLGTILIVVFIIVIFLSFVTAADSMSSTVALLSVKEDTTKIGEPPTTIKILWGAIIGVLGWVMICFSGIDGAKMLATIASFPMLFIMTILLISAVKGMNRVLEDEKNDEKKIEISNEIDKD